MMDVFAQLLNDLGLLLDTPLSPDKRGACRLNIEDTLHVQLESDANRENLLIWGFLAEIPPGKFRENVLRDALKANIDTTAGTLGFSDRNNQMLLFSRLNFSSLHAKELLEFLRAFIAKGHAWQQAITTGQTINLLPDSKQKSLSPFDLKL